MSQGTMLLKMKSMLPSLSIKEQQIARFILDDPKTASRMTISDISSQLDMADSTIFKFTKRLGYSGFRDFRNELLSEEYDPQVSVHENIKASDTTDVVAQKVFQSSINSLHDTAALLRKDDLDRAVNTIMESRSLSFFGYGGSNAVALDAYQKFLRSPIPCQHSLDSHIQVMQASLLTERDCAIVISHTGLSKSTIEVAETLKDVGCKIIVLTSHISSKLSDYADITFVSASEETGYRSESLSCRISQLTVIDSLFTSVMFRMPDTADSLKRIRHAINRTKVE